jgi:hypothetical protein
MTGDALKRCFIRDSFLHLPAANQDEAQRAGQIL